MNLQSALKTAGADEWELMLQFSCVEDQGERLSRLTHSLPRMSHGRRLLKFFKI